MSSDNNVLRKRDLEINNLVSSINDLSHIFKEMANLVNEQGTILDRIDYNIEHAIVNVKKANTHLKKVADDQDSPTSNCARNAIMALIAINFLLGLMLIIKIFT